LRNAYKILVEKSEEKKTHRGYKHSWEYNIKTDLKAIVWIIFNWLKIAPLTGSYEHGNETLVCMKGGKFLN
jgi:hypothetical protein